MPENKARHGNPMRNERTFSQVCEKITELEALLGNLKSEEIQYISRTMQGKDFWLKTRFTILVIDLFCITNNQGKQFELLKDDEIIKWWREFSNINSEEDRKVVQELYDSWKEPSGTDKKEYVELYSRFRTKLMELENIFFGMSAEEFIYISGRSEMQTFSSDIMVKFTMLLMYMGAINDLMAMYKREACFEDEEGEES